MKFVRIEPPGTFCQYAAIEEMMRKTGARRFVEVGCGAGYLSLKLCQSGLCGTGYDFSSDAIGMAEQHLRTFIEKGQYRLIQKDLLTYDGIRNDVQADLAISMMVLEHIHEEERFIRKMAEFVVPGGYVILGVPGRRDRWSIEDVTVGHLRRYDRQDLTNIMEISGLEKVEVWSVAVPTANMLLGLGNFFLRRSSEMEKLRLSQRQQTETSGTREIPFKTTFPKAFQLILNPRTLAPLLFIQRFFYKTNLGLTMLGIGQVPLQPIGNGI